MTANIIAAGITFLGPPVNRVSKSQGGDGKGIQRNKPPAVPATPPERALTEMLSLGVSLSSPHRCRMMLLDAANVVPSVNH